MNCFEAYTVEVPGGYHGMVRFSHKAQAWPILNHGEPIVFTMKSAALIAAQEQLIKHINGTMTRQGDKIDMAKSAANKIFRKGGRVIAVERRGA